MCATQPQHRRVVVGTIRLPAVWAVLVAFAVVAGATTEVSAQIPDRSYSPDLVGGVISSDMGAEAHNQPTVVNGHLLLAGNGSFSFWDISDPFNPRRVSSFESNHNEDEAESHAISHQKMADGRIVTATISGRGIDIWDISDVTSPTLLSEMMLEGIDYGDNTNAVWGVAWQGETLYVGGTNTGLHVVDASDLEAPQLAVRVPTSELGGVSAGPTFAIGNLLVTSTPKNFAGVATVDISDPHSPAVLDFVVPETDSYIGWFYGRHAHLLRPFRSYDVVSDPANIELVGSVESPPSEYMSFGDGFLFLGELRPAPGARKVRLDDLTNLDFSVRIEGRRDDVFNGFLTDDQFSVPVGNLLVLSDDEIGIGSALAVHDAQRDSVPPRVAYVNPPDGATSQPVTTRIGISLTDQIDLSSLTTANVTVRPVDGGASLEGHFGLNHAVVNFAPLAPLEEGTTYEVVLRSGGISDLVGNTLSDEYRWVFSTGEDVTAPVCEIEATSPTPIGTDVAFRAADAGDSAEYRWEVAEIGEIGTSPAPEVLHRFADPGRYRVTLTVEQDGASRTCTAIQIIHRPLVDGGDLGDRFPAASSTLALVEELSAGWVANTDASTLSSFSTSDHLVAWEVETVANPTSVSADADHVYVVGSGEDAVAVHDAVTGELLERFVVRHGAAPYGSILESSGDGLWVTLEATGELIRMDTSTGEITDRIELAAATDLMPPAVRDIARSADGETLYVARFISSDDAGSVYEIDVQAREVRRTISLAIDPTPDASDDGRGLPNYLGAIAVSPDGTRLWVPSKKDNIERGTARDGLPLNTTNTVRTIVSAVDTTAGDERLDERVDLDDHNMAAAAIASPVGDLVFVASLGTNRVDVFNAYDGTRIAGFSTELAPRALALSAAGVLYVDNFLSRTVSAYDVSGILRGTDSAASEIAIIDSVAEEPLPDDVLLGKQIFYNADSRQMSQDGYVSCASCHLDGGQDGRIWDFTDRGEGLRNTIDLRGRAGTAHGPLHWSANFDEVHDFEHDIRAHFGGAGLMTEEDFRAEGRDTPLGGEKAGVSEQLDALAAYVTSLDRVPRSPYRNADGSMTEAGRRGHELFVTLDCLDCHTGQALTDSPSGQRHDVGTLRETSGGRLGDELGGIDTPTLRGVWATPPYFHDGSAPTLEATLRTEGHGDAQALTEGEMGDLVAFLLELENDELDLTRPEPSAGGDAAADATADAGGDARALDATADADTGATPSSGSGGGCASLGPSAQRGSLWLVLALLVALRVRSRRLRVSA